MASIPTAAAAGIANFANAMVDYNGILTGHSFQPATGDEHVISTPLLEMAFGINQPIDAGSTIGDGYFGTIGTTGIGGLGGATYSLPANETIVPVNDDPAPLAGILQSVFGEAGATVAMPSADMLAGAFGQVGPAASHIEQMFGLAGVGGDAAQHTGEVSRVLIDALAGGDGAPNIDGLLAALPQNIGGSAMIDAPASHGMGAVSAWDMGGFGGFQAFHSAFTMEAMVLHQTVVQAA
jgi:hypothetical protein